MKKIISIIFSALLVLTFCSACNNESRYTNYDEGYDDGYFDGEEDAKTYLEYRIESKYLKIYTDEVHDAFILLEEYNAGFYDTDEPQWADGTIEYLDEEQLEDAIDTILDYWRNVDRLVTEVSDYCNNR